MFLTFTEINWLKWVTNSLLLLNLKSMFNIFNVIMT